MCSSFAVAAFWGEDRGQDCILATCATDPILQSTCQLHKSPGPRARRRDIARFSLSQTRSAVKGRMSLTLVPSVTARDLRGFPNHGGLVSFVWPTRKMNADERCCNVTWLLGTTLTRSGDPAMRCATSQSLLPRPIVPASTLHRPARHLNCCARIVADLDAASGQPAKHLDLRWGRR